MSYNKNSQHYHDCVCFNSIRVDPLFNRDTDYALVLNQYCQQRPKGEQFDWMLWPEFQNKPLAQATYNVMAYATLKRLIKEDYDGRNIVRVLKEVLTKDETTDEWSFTTIGFNEQTITAGLMDEVRKKMQEPNPHWEVIAYQHEKHTATGIHHHTHYILKHKKQLPPSKLSQYIYTLKGVKKLVLGQNFIDVIDKRKSKKKGKSYEEYLGYVNGIKSNIKEQFLCLDQEWREKSNI